MAWSFEFADDDRHFVAREVGPVTSATLSLESFPSAYQDTVGAVLIGGVGLLLVTNATVASRFARVRWQTAGPVSLLENVVQTAVPAGSTVHVDLVPGGLATTIRQGTLRDDLSAHIALQDPHSLIIDVINLQSPGDTLSQIVVHGVLVPASPQP